MIYDEKNKLKLLHDNPLEFKTNQNEYKNDGLNFNIYADVVSQSIIDTQTPFTVGIYGKWGKGKTSFLNMLRVRVDDKKWKTNHTTVWFNAWQYEKEKHLIVPLIATIVKALKDDKGKIESGYEDIVDTLQNIASSIKINISYKSPSLFGIKAFFSATNNKRITERVLDESIYYDSFNELSKLSSKLADEKKIIVFIDDLDRCFPPNAVKLLENIKLVLSQKGFVFVIGVAKEVIEKYLYKRYKDDFGITEGNHDKSYLEKIIQLSFTLPKFNTQTKELVNSLYEKVDGKNQKEMNVVIVLLEAIIDNSNISPRLLVRVINQSKIHSRIYKKLNESKEEKIENIFDLYMFALLFENLYEKAYETLSKCTDNQLKVFIKEIEQNKNTELKIDSKVKEMKEQSDSDENLKKLLTTDIAQDWLKDFNKRQVTSEFIDLESGKSEEDIKEEKEEIKENFKSEILELEKNIKTEDDFKRLIYDGEKTYKTFIDNLVDKKGNEFGFSKFLVTNIWYDEYLKGKKEDYGEKFNHDFKPVVGVSYNEAIEFCNSLNGQNDGYKYSLPSKEQFEYVAKGSGENRKYPWGDKYNNKFCNNSDIGLNKTSIVGAFKIGVSKDGICDMSGNVWKWTSFDFDKDNKVVKGGSWGYGREDGFASSSDINFRPGYRSNFVGFFLTRTKK